MSSEKSDFYGTINANTSAKFVLDKQIYKAEVLSAVGLTATPPADNIDIVKQNFRAAVATGKFVLLKVLVTDGVGDTAKTRTIRLICETSKINTARALKGSTLTLGNLTTRSWTIKQVST
jgi:hypothetical protein